MNKIFTITFSFLFLCVNCLPLQAKSVNTNLSNLTPPITPKIANTFQELEHYYSPEYVWDLDSSQPIQQFINKTQTIIIRSKNFFEVEDFSFDPDAHHLNLSLKSTKQENGLFEVRIDPIDLGGKRKIQIRNVLRTITQSHYYVREDFTQYLDFTNNLISGLNGYLQTKGYHPLLYPFQLTVEDNFTVDKNKSLLIDVVDHGDTELIKLSFKLIKRIKRGRYKIKRDELYEMLFYQLYHKDLLTKNISVKQKPPETETTSLTHIQKLKKADETKPWNQRILQVNARVDGFKLNEISEEDIIRWKKAGFNSIWMLGIWKVSEYSFHHNHHWRNYHNKRGADSHQTGSSFSIAEYAVNQDIGGLKSLLKLKELFKKHGLNLVLDFVPNHFGISSKHVYENPDFFVNEKLDSLPYLSNDFLLEHKYQQHIPEDWPQHPEGDGENQPLFDIWHGKNFQEVSPDKQKDHFILRKLKWTRDNNVWHYKVLEAYKIQHGAYQEAGELWHDTAQVNYLNPYAREFMREQYLKIAELADGVRWDYVDATLKDKFKKNWHSSYNSDPKIHKENWSKFHRKWKGVTPDQLKTPEQWRGAFDSFLNDYFYAYMEDTHLPKPTIDNEYAKDFLQDVIDSFIKYLNDRNYSTTPYFNLVYAFYDEGLGQTIYESLFDEIEDLTFVHFRERISKNLDDLRYHEFMERTILEAKKVHPAIFNFVETYHSDKNYLTMGIGDYLIDHIGIDAVYDIGPQKISTSHDFFESMHQLIDIIRETDKELISKLVYFIQNHDEPPILSELEHNKNEALIKLSLLAIVGNMHLYEIGMMEGITSRLGATEFVKRYFKNDSLGYELDGWRNLMYEQLLPVLNQYTSETKSPPEVISFYSGQVRGFKRNVDGKEIYVLYNFTPKDQSLNLPVFSSQDYQYKKVLSITQNKKGVTTNKTPLFSNKDPNSAVISANEFIVIEAEKTNTFDEVLTNLSEFHDRISKITQEMKTNPLPLTEQLQKIQESLNDLSFLDNHKLNNSQTNIKYLLTQIHSHNIQSGIVPKNNHIYQSSLKAVRLLIRDANRSEDKRDLYSKIYLLFKNIVFETLIVLSTEITHRDPHLASKKLQKIQSFLDEINQITGHQDIIFPFVKKATSLLTLAISDVAEAKAYLTHLDKLRTLSQEQREQDTIFRSMATLNHLRYIFANPSQFNFENTEDIRNGNEIDYFYLTKDLAYLLARYRDLNKPTLSVDEYRLRMQIVEVLTFVGITDKEFFFQDHSADILQKLIDKASFLSDEQINELLHSHSKFYRLMHENKILFQRDFLIYHHLNITPYQHYDRNNLLLDYDQLFIHKTFSELFYLYLTEREKTILYRHFSIESFTSNVENFALMGNPFLKKLRILDFGTTSPYIPYQFSNKWLDTISKSDFAGNSKIKKKTYEKEIDKTFFDFLLRENREATEILKYKSA